SGYALSLISCSYASVRLPLLLSSAVMLRALATTESYTLSLHDALPICARSMKVAVITQYYPPDPQWIPASLAQSLRERGHDVKVDRKSTRLNSSHVKISYAVFCLKKKKSRRT